MAWHDLQLALSIEVEQSGGLFQPEFRNIITNGKKD